MKRARPKNKKAAIKREREFYEQERAARSAQHYDEPENTDEYTEPETQPQNVNKYENIIEEIQHERAETGSVSPEEPRPRYSQPAVSAQSGAKGKPVKGKKKKKKHRALKIILTVLVIFAALGFITMGLDIFDDSDVLTPLENGKINVLMLGVDEEGLRTDAIMIASYDVNEAQVNMLSVPRDTKVYVTNRDVTRKINEVHAMSSKQKSGEILGAEATAEAVSQLTGIPINYYVEFSFSAIDNLFDALGPVEFDVPDVEGKGRGMNYDDPVQNLHIHLKPGLQQLTGNEVQQFVRYRKSNSGAGSGSDTDRVARQQEFVKAVVDQKVNVTLIPKLPGIFAQLSKEIKTNISAGDVTRYLRYLNKLTGESMHSYSLPGETKTIRGGSYFICNLEETKVLMNDTFGYDAELTDKITLSEKYSQQILKGGNLTKKNKKSSKTDNSTAATTAPENNDKNTGNNSSNSKKTTAQPKASSTPTPEPTKAPAVTKKPVQQDSLEEIFDEE